MIHRSVTVIDVAGPATVALQRASCDQAHALINRTGPCG